MPGIAALREYLAELPVISAHEHHREDGFFRAMTLERLLGHSYVGWASHSGPPVEDRAGFLDYVGQNAYFVWLERGLRHIYGCERLTPETWERIDAAIRQAHTDPDWHLTMLTRHGGYRRAIQDAYWAPGADMGHPELFSPTLRVNCFVWCHHPEMRDHNEQSPWALAALPRDHFDDYLEAVAAFIAARKAAGAVALKSALAYDRAIDFQPREKTDAARAFGRRDASSGDVRAYQDFMFDYLCQLAGRYELPFQNHTGLGLIAGSNPMGLEPMIARHRHTRFVLFHGGYPWVGEVAGLAHNYGNVYPDLTWLPLISPTAAICAVREWIEVAHSSTRICWGGDAWTGEESVGAVLALRHVLAVALGSLVDEGYFTLDDARCAARRLCYENAGTVYSLR